MCKLSFTFRLGLAIAIAAPCIGQANAEPPMRKKRVEYGIGRTESKSDKKKSKDANASISMELLTGSEGAGAKAREWSELLSKMNVTLTIRRARPGEKPDVSEQKAGTARSVQITGLLDSQGRALFSDRMLTIADSDKLASWLDDLRAYGAQGKPDGQPVWGLTREQFGVLHAALKKPLASDPKDLDFEKALAMFELPRDYPLKIDPGAARLLKRDQAQTVSQSLEGVSQGTALALVLQEYGLGFRPRRLPDGSLELAIESLKATHDVWPVGWRREHPIPEIAPVLFEFKVVSLEDLPLDEVLDTIAAKIRIPILVDRAGLAAKGIDFSKLTVTYPRDRTTWINVIKTFTAKAKTQFDVRIDESGRPFVWIAPLNTAERARKE